MYYSSIFAPKAFKVKIPFPCMDWIYFTTDNLDFLGLSYENLKGDSNGNDIVSFSFSEKVFDQCASKCNENRDCVGFTHAKPTPSPGVQNCNLKSVVHYPPTIPSDASQRTAYMLRKYIAI